MKVALVFPHSQQKGLAAWFPRAFVYIIGLPCSSVPAATPWLDTAVSKDASANAAMICVL